MKMARERYRESFAKGKVTFRETSISRCNNLDHHSIASVGVTSLLLGEFAFSLCAAVRGVTLFRWGHGGLGPSGSTCSCHQLKDLLIKVLTSVLGLWEVPVTCDVQKHCKAKGETQQRYPATDALSLEIRGTSFFCPKAGIPERYPKRFGCQCVTMSTSDALNPGKHHTNIQPMPFCC